MFLIFGGGEVFWSGFAFLNKSSLDLVWLGRVQDNQATHNDPKQQYPPRKDAAFTVELLNFYIDTFEKHSYQGFHTWNVCLEIHHFKFYCLLVEEPTCL